MMKNITLLLTTLLIASLAYSQCTPDPKYTAPGFYSSAGANKLPDAIIGVAYSEVITIITFKDTTIAGLGTFNLDKIVLKNVTNLPNGIVYSTPSNTIKGGASGCALLSGKPTGGPGPVTVKIEVDIYLVGLPVQTNVEDFVMNVSWPVSTQEKNIDFNEVKIAPNPVKGKSTFYLNNKTTGEVELSIHNLLGEKVYSVIHFAEDLNSEIEFDASNLPSGIYTYSLSSNESNKIGRIIIAGL